MQNDIENVYTNIRDMLENIGNIQNIVNMQEYIQEVYENIQDLFRKQIKYKGNYIQNIYIYANTRNMQENV